MIIKHLRIENFRGIRSLDWHLEGRVICLIGPNDSTKTTILDAIELVLLPRWYVGLTDADFHNANVEYPIIIEATVGDLPVELLGEEKFGLYLRGYSNGEIQDDPNDGNEPVLSIRFTIDQELDPTWEVFKDSQDQPRLVRWRDRERLGLVRMSDSDRHLTWARGSALSQLTGEDPKAGQTFVEVARAAKKVVANADLKQLSAAASKAKTSTRTLGAQFDDLRPGLDISSLSLGGSVLGLHNSNIPARLWGLGTRRLAALAIQQEGAGKHSILVIDEIEYGLEPHRIRHVLRKLTRDPDLRERKYGQLIVSTHSPTSTLELPIQSLRFARSSAGETTIAQVSDNSIDCLQGIARTHSYAFFGRKLLICEGATEVGLCRGLDEYWAKNNSGNHPTHVGFVAVDGKGRTEAPNVALELKRIGYDVAVFADSDEPLVPGSDVLESQNIITFLWPGSMSTEQRLAMDLPLSSLQELLNEAYQEIGRDSVLSQIGNYCGIPNLCTKGENITDWIDVMTETKARESIGKAAKIGKWFKNVTLGIRLGEVLCNSLSSIPSTPTATLLDQSLPKWIYG
jgi:hypothetical protein